MALINPLYSLIFPFLLIFTIPVAIFAGITSALAFAILLFRVILIYIELAIAIIPHYLLGSKYRPLYPHQSVTSTSPTTQVRRRKRRSSTSSNISATGTITPVRSESGLGLSLSQSGLGLSQSIGPTRDFEGVGGWRLDNPSDDDALWTNINTRLELPADHVRRHQRSLTSGCLPVETRIGRNYSTEAVMNTSRTRTPPSSALLGFSGDGYFALMPSVPRAAKRVPSAATAVSASSGSSKGSVLHMKQK